jgi:hypothetical protein
MLNHHVLFWLKNPDSVEDRTALIAGLEKCRAIPEIRQAYFGLPVPSHRAVVDSSYAVSSLLLFDSVDDERLYQDHPLHQAFIAECGHLWSKVLVFDSLDV